MMGVGGCCCCPVVSPPSPTFTPTDAIVVDMEAEDIEYELTDFLLLDDMNIEEVSPLVSYCQTERGENEERDVEKGGEEEEEECLVSCSTNDLMLSYAADLRRSRDSAAVIEIQAWLRSLMGRKELLKMRKARDSRSLEAANAAIVIQSMVRSRRCQIELQRKKVLAEDEEKRKNEIAATNIQSLLRSWACQRELRQKRAIMHSLEIAKLALAAITIQAVFRSWTCRKELMVRKEQAEQAQAVSAATRIQAFVRASQYHKGLFLRRQCELETSLMVAGESWMAEVEGEFRDADMETSSDRDHRIIHRNCSYGSEEEQHREDLERSRFVDPFPSPLPSPPSTPQQSSALTFKDPFPSPPQSEASTPQQPSALTTPIKLASINNQTSCCDPVPTPYLLEISKRNVSPESNFPLISIPIPSGSILGLHPSPRNIWSALDAGPDGHELETDKPINRRLEFASPSELSCEGIQHRSCDLATLTNPKIIAGSTWTDSTTKVKVQVDQRRGEATKDATIPTHLALQALKEKSPRTVVNAAGELILSPVRSVVQSSSRGAAKLVRNTRQRLKNRRLRRFARMNNPPRSWWICIPADHPCKVAWDILTMIWAVLGAYRTHIRIRDRVFDQSPLILLTEIWFTIDILLNFITEHKTRQGEVIRDGKAIWARYITTWFIIDILSLIPWESIYVQPIVDKIKSRNFFQKTFFRSKAVIRVSRVLRGRHIKLFGKVSKRSGISLHRLVALVIKYLPKYLLFLRNMKGALVVRALRLIHWLHNMYKKIWVKAQNAKHSMVARSASGEEEEEDYDVNEDDFDIEDEESDEHINRDNEGDNEDDSLLMNDELSGGSSLLQMRRSFSDGILWRQD